MKKLGLALAVLTLCTQAFAAENDICARFDSNVKNLERELEKADLTDEYRKDRIIQIVESFSDFNESYYEQWYLLGLIDDFTEKTDPEMWKNQTAQKAAFDISRNKELVDIDAAMKMLNTPQARRAACSFDRTDRSLSEYLRDKEPRDYSNSYAGAGGLGPQATKY